MHATAHDVLPEAPAVSPSPAPSHSLVFSPAAAVAAANAAVASSPSDRELRAKIPVCEGWKFSRCPQTEAAAVEYTSAGTPNAISTPTSVDFDDAQWVNATLPHTPRIEAAAVQFPFQGICWYRRTIAPRADWKVPGRRIILEFGAGMQIAEVWVNGEFRLRHLGGYLPFSVDLTTVLGKGEPAAIAVRLDNRDTPLCPPGKPIAELDFSYFGGLYREAHLHVTDDLQVSDPLLVDCEAGGGIFIRSDSISESRATVWVKTHVLNQSTLPARKCQVTSEIIGPDGAVLLSQTSYPLMIGAGDGHHFIQRFDVENPALWHPDHPHLYKLRTRVLKRGFAMDETTTRFGIRHVAAGKRFRLNGKELAIMGTNRHQEYPYLGNAVPANAQRRDAVRIKEAGFNFVRLSHYPQDPSFLDACDELGLMVQAAIPGWQQFHMNASFTGRSFQDTRELVQRDRNHPSIIFWEPNLNETGVGEEGEGHADWCRAAHEITHLEFPGDQCLTFGDDYPEKPGWDWDVLGLWREYGDFAFGGNESTSRHTRGEGENALLQQAWNFIWTFNHLNAKFSDPAQAYLGCATWVMFDYNRGYYHKPCNCGMMDIFRLPKYVYYFYQSQRSSAAPMVCIASDWTPREGSGKVVVFSNGDEVELSLNGRVIARLQPDSGPDTEYSQRDASRLATVGDNYDRSGGNPFDGGNASHIPHPPFTFTKVPYEPGALTATAYLRGERVAIHQVTTPGQPRALELSIDTAGIPVAEHQMDAVFVRARLTDAVGNVVPDNSTAVSFRLDAGSEGGTELIGANPVLTDAGIASIILKTSNAASLRTTRIEAVATSVVNLAAQQSFVAVLEAGSV